MSKKAKTKAAIERRKEKQRRLPGAAGAMNRTFACVLAFGLVACTPRTPPPPAPQPSPGDFTCTKEQMQRAQEEHMFCKNHTMYFTSACWLTSLQRNCVEKTKQDAGLPVGKNATPPADPGSDRSVR